MKMFVSLLFNDVFLTAYFT